MCPITTILFFLSFGFPLLNAQSDDGVKPAINVTECFELPEVKNSFNDVDRCFYDIVKAQINQTLTGSGNCSNVDDLERQYGDLTTNLGIYCPHLHFRPTNSSYNTTILDVLKVALDSNKFSELINADGLSCLRKISEPIRTCRKNSVQIYTNNNNTKISFWKRTMVLTIDSFNCGQQDSLLNCTMPELNKHCEEKSINYIKSILDVINPKCEVVKSLAQTMPDIPIEEASTAVYWVIGAIAIVAIAGITIFFIKKRKTRHSVPDAVYEMK